MRAPNQSIRVYISLIYLRVSLTHNLLEDDFLEQPGGSTRPSVGQRDEAKKESSLHLGSNCYASELDLSNFSMK